MRLRLEQNNEGTEEVVIRYETMTEKLKGFIGYIKQYTTELQGKKKRRALSNRNKRNLLY